MRCLICNRSFQIRRSFSSLLSKQICFVCDSCYRRFPIELGYQVIPTTNHLVYVYNMFQTIYHFQNDPFMLEYGKIFDYLSNNHRQIPIMLYEKLRLNSFELDNLEHITQIFDSNIIILCYFIEDVV